MRNTLVLTVDPAAPPISGAELRNWQNASALAEIGRVTLVSLHPISGPTHPLDGRIECAALTDAAEKRARALVRRRTSVDVRMTRPALTRLTAIAAALKPDAILVEGIPLFPFLKPLRPLTPTLVLDMHNIESDLAAQTAAPSIRTRLLASLLGSDATRIRELEREAVAMVDRVWVCSEADRERLRRLFGTGPTVDVVPNGIPRPKETPAELPAPAGRARGWPVILFVGHLAYAPNIATVDFLARQVLPLIQADFPDARLIVGGRSPADDVLAAATAPGVELFADPPDVSELYAQAHFAVIPLLSAGGTRIKILEAAARGLPVVATRLAAEGLGLVEGTDILVAETARGLADHVTALCRDPERFEMLRRNAKQSVMARFSPAAIAAAVRSGITAPTTVRHDPSSGGDRHRNASQVSAARSIAGAFRGPGRVSEERPIILFFNAFFGEPVDPSAFACGDACVFTNDRGRLKEAAVVVFHIPSLGRIGRLRKPAGQLWVAWSMESRVSYPRLADPSFMRQFDLIMSYEQSADIWTPYLPTAAEFDRALATPIAPKTADAPVAMFQSATLDPSGRNPFARELMSHMRVDSYGKFMNNRKVAGVDRGRETKRATISSYKFCIAFENSIAVDYVTEKFFDPLLSGSVPVYRGAPNVDMYAPGDNAFIDASKFSGPRELAEFLVHLDHDDDAYRRYLAWREAGLSSAFKELLSRTAREPFCRLGEIVLARSSASARQTTLRG